MTCPSCGMQSHRYGPDDPNHRPDKTACVNALRWEMDQLREILSAVLGPGLTAEEFRVRYLAADHDLRCQSVIEGLGGARLVCSRGAHHVGHHSDGQASWTQVAKPVS